MVTATGAGCPAQTLVRQRARQSGMTRLARGYPSTAGGGLTHDPLRERRHRRPLQSGLPVSTSGYDPHLWAAVPSDPLGDARTVDDCGGRPLPSNDEHLGDACQEPFAGITTAGGGLAHDSPKGAPVPAARLERALEAASREGERRAFTHPTRARAGGDPITSRRTTNAKPGDS
jgi:hypothetical protein